MPGATGREGEASVGYLCEQKSMLFIDAITAYYHVNSKEPLIFEHFFWMAAKMPYIHRQGQQLTAEEIKLTRLLCDGIGYLSTHDTEITVATFKVCD